MDWQQMVSLIIVALAALLLLRDRVRRWHRARTSPCGGSCACASSLPPDSPHQLPSAELFLGRTEKT